MPQSSSLNGNLVALGNSVYFTAEGGDQFPQLWKSDGTSAGTIQLAQFSDTSSLNSLTDLGGKLVFVANDGTSWRRASGRPTERPRSTTALTNFNGLSVALMDNVNGTEYFDVYDGTNSQSGQLWKSDGTPGGTAEVLATGGNYDLAGDFTAVGNTIYFIRASLSPTDGTDDQYGSSGRSETAPLRR